MNLKIKTKKWRVIYPSYINKKLTRKEGRRLPKEACCDDPKVEEMKMVCDFLRIPCIIERKAYPR